MCSKTGFTILEVLIAMGILAVSMVGLNALRTDSTIRALEAEQITVATMLAREKIAETEIEFRNVKFSEIKKSDAGEFENFPSFKWERTVEEFELNISIPKTDSGSEEDSTMKIVQLLSEILSKHILKITLKVNFQVIGKDREIEVVTHIVDLLEDIQIPSL